MHYKAIYVPKVKKWVFNLLICKKLHRENGKNLSHDGSFVGVG